MNPEEPIEMAGAHSEAFGQNRDTLLLKRALRDQA